ncbi:putative magnesium transporter NIPA6 [Porphyridium purpureum]|uniref:Putative magnesium transporter NIPA6 n=1 Tax=Porphyridium purpureum TaxID=35688 RepID=A0A5J4YPD4_PORPP|nr:putative magnesium transporter NIPA6 [Porphyridium purpureum]|eukprot:POR6627..scf222_8
MAVGAAVALPSVARDEMMMVREDMVWLGVLLAVIGNVLIAVGFLLQKMAHNKRAAEQALQNSAAGEVDAELLCDGRNKPCGEETLSSTDPSSNTLAEQDLEHSLSQTELDPAERLPREEEDGPALERQPTAKEKLLASHVGYLGVLRWWVGLLCIFAGECLNAVAYAFASGSLIPPLGTIALVLITIFSRFALRERLSCANWFGVVLLAAAVILVSVYSPDSEQSTGPMSSDELWTLIKQPQFYSVLIVVVVGIVVGAYLVFRRPDWAHRSPWLLVCVAGLIGAIKSRSFKAIAQMVRDSVADNISSALFWVMIAVMIGSVVGSLYYLNRGMAIFDQARFLPLYFGVFVLASVLTNMLLYDEFNDPSFNLGGFLGGISLILIGCVFLSMPQSWITPEEILHRKILSLKRSSTCHSAEGGSESDLQRRRSVSV